jgi:hypothetical protein
MPWVKENGIEFPVLLVAIIEISLISAPGIDDGRSKVAERFTTKELSGVARLETAKLYLNKTACSTPRTPTMIR